MDKEDTGKASADDRSVVLGGTTLMVYRFLFRLGTPQGIHDIQKGLGMSSPSVAHYHIQKLLGAGLVREEGAGYVVDRAVFENMLRIRRTVIPLQTAYLAFFISTTVVLGVFFRPSSLTSLYFFALATNIAAVAIASFETWRAFRGV